MKNGVIWKIALPLTAFLAALAFVPAVIPERITEPFVLGMPRTLWASMALSVAIYAVLIAAMIFSGDGE